MCDARARCASAVAARRSATRRPSPRTLPSMPRGLPLPPADEHAISASMPLWSDVVGYEEGDTWVHAQLALGYPRFVYHPSTQELFEHLEDTRGDGDEAMVVFPSAAAAGRCQAFVARSLRGLRACYTGCRWGPAAARGSPACVCDSFINLSPRSILTKISIESIFVVFSIMENINSSKFKELFELR